MDLAGGRQRGEERRLPLAGKQRGIGGGVGGLTPNPDTWPRAGGGRRGVADGAPRQRSETWRDAVRSTPFILSLSKDGVGRFGKQRHGRWFL